MQLFRLYKLYKSHFKKKPFILFLLHLISALFEGVGIALIIPLLSQLSNNEGVSNQSQFMNRILESVGIEAETTSLILLVVAAFYMKALTTFITGWFEARMTSKLEYDVREELLGYFKKLSFEHFSLHNSGHYNNLVMWEIRRCIEAVKMSVQFVSGILYGMVLIGIGIWINWIFSLLALTLSLGIVFIVRVIGKKVKRISFKEVQTQRKLGQLNIQFINGFKYLKATNKAGLVVNHMTEMMKKLKDYFYKTQLAKAFAKSINEPLVLTVLVIAVYVSVFYFDVNISTLIVTILLLYRAMGRMMRAQTSWQSLMSASGSVDFVLNESIRIRNNVEVNGVEKHEKNDIIIKFSNLSFSYNQGEPVLRNIDLEVKRNETLAIVGESGSGKSTVLDLITAVQRPDEGEIVFGGKNSKSIDIWEWRSNIGYVTQEIVMFDDSIQNNVTLWDDSNKEEVNERVEQSIMMANADDFIFSKEIGLQTEIGDRGLRLSGGQKQRVSIARELYKRPSILILDEATSALDTESEKIIKNSIDRLKGQFTVVLVAHRLSTVQNADKIVVMDKGEIVESGSYNDLINRQGKFYNMVQLQSLTT